MSAIQELSFNKMLAKLMPVLLSTGIPPEDAVAVGGNIVTVFLNSQGEYSSPEEVAQKLSLEEIARKCATAQNYDEWGWNNVD